MSHFNLESALEALLVFRSERDWMQFHTPKNLSMSIAIESAELMEHFQWKSNEEVKQYLTTDNLHNVKDEIADIASYLLLLSHDLGIDLNQSIMEKVKKNAAKYPIEKSKGKHDKYNEL
ncbi:MAG: nucleotide pyrophosphohydrolase [Clostridia bacterium]|nr:nucleotide pyrophosphohydrolase [Clostridia bacterium]